MKNLFAVLIFLMPFSSYCQTYYLAANGNDANSGNIATPFKSFAKFKAVATPGDTLFIRGGIYRTSGNAATSNHFVIEDLNGDASDPIVIQAYPGEYPVFNLDNITPTNTDANLMKISDCKYIKIKGIRLTGLKQVTTGNGLSRGLDIYNVQHSDFELLEVDHIGGYGVIIDDNCDDLLFKNCDAHHIDDRYTSDPGANGPWQNANGFQCTGGSNATNITFDGCRAWWISDDGFDLYSVNGVFIFRNCWSFWNGYEPGTFNSVGDGNGFKLGPSNGGVHNTVKRYLYNCLAFENGEHGFDRNAGDMAYVLYNNTAALNNAYGFRFDYSPNNNSNTISKNNMSYANSAGSYNGSNITGSNNSWNFGLPVMSDFVSTSSAGMDGPRQVDGSLPKLSFMHLQNGSPYIDAGADVGIPFIGAAPDIGAFETQTTNVPEILMCGNLPVKLPASTTYLCGSVKTGTGEAPFSYQWQMISGPSIVTFTSPNGADTYIGNFIAGTYQFKLTVTDANNNVGAGFVTVVILPGPLPTHFKILTAQATPTGINIAWSAQLSSLSKSFKIERKRFRRFETIATKAAMAEGKMVDKPSSGTYTYRILAIDSDGTTVTGPEATVTYKKKASLSLKL